jgi:glutamate-5-semialdehyde dehydrogenase
MNLRELIEEEALAAARAAPALTDAGVADALDAAAALVRERRREVLAANAADCEAASDQLDEGTLDRLRLDDARVEAIARQVEATAGLAPLEREIEERILPNGLRVSERRVPIGVVGANFEARPNVALDVAGQLLKGLNTAVLRTGGAALRTVTALVDEALRPALERAGLPSGAVGLVRTADHEGARVLVTMPKLVPLVILRGSGATTAELARRAAEHGVATLAHAEGGGVLYVHEAALREKALAIAEASLDRLGVCNRLNLAVVDRGALPLLDDLLDLFGAKQLEVRGTETLQQSVSRSRYARTPAMRALRACVGRRGWDAKSRGVLALDRPLGYEWASDPERVATVTIAVAEGLDDAVRIANEETSGLAAAIVTEDERAAEQFLSGYRGTAAFWNAPTRFADGFELTGAPETGINVGFAPGPRGPVTYRDLWLRQYRVVGDGTQRR